VGTGLGSGMAAMIADPREAERRLDGRIAAS
jgi:hypothetical protein